MDVKCNTFQNAGCKQPTMVCISIVKLLHLHTARIIDSIHIECGSQSFNFEAENLPNLGVSHHLKVIGTGATYMPPENSHNLGVNHHLKVIGTGATYIPPENSPNLGVNHHLKVIGTGSTYIPAENSPNLGVSHHLEMIGTGATYIPMV